MFIFQANGKIPLSEESLVKWSDYLEKQCEKDTSILLPDNIDFIAAINMNFADGGNIMFVPTEQDDINDNNDNLEMLDNEE